MAANEIGIQEVRVFWDRRPCNVRHSQKPVGSREYCEEVRARRYFVEPHIVPFADFSAWRGKRVLEIGCGIGTDLSRFAEAGALVTGTELSSESLEITKKSFATLGLAGRFYAVDAEELSNVVPVEPYDLIYSFGVIHHSPHPERIIAEIKKYMGAKSELRIMLYAKYSWKSLMILFRLDQPEAQYGCPIANTYSARDVRELLLGFDVVSITKDHIFPYRIKEYKEYRYVKTFFWSFVPVFLANILKKYLGWHLLIRARRAR